MFNLSEILRNAQGGQALDNLATQFGTTAEEADAAVKAVMPALPAPFFEQASEPQANAIWRRVRTSPLVPPAYPGPLTLRPGVRPPM
ncbi:MAG: hypothetical protein WBW81_12110 [Methylocella sp.]